MLETGRSIRPRVTYDENEKACKNVHVRLRVPVSGMENAWPKK